MEEQFAVCVKNDDYSASLELRKIYRVLPDRQAASHRLLRIVDESGSDYLYPEDYFVFLEVPQAVVQLFEVAE